MLKNNHNKLKLYKMKKQLWYLNTKSNLLKWKAYSEVIRMLSFSNFSKKQHNYNNKNKSSNKGSNKWLSNRSKKKL